MTAPTIGTGTKLAMALTPTVTTIASTSRTIMIRPINRWRSMSRCRVPKISVSENSMAAKMLLALHSRPPMETSPSKPADSRTPSRAFCSSGWALVGNT